MLFNTRRASDRAVPQPKAADLLEYKEESAGEQDEPQCERQHAALTRHDDATVTVEAVLPGKHLPFSPGSLGLVLGQRSRWRCRGRCRECLRIYLLILAGFHPSRRWNQAAPRSVSIKHQLLRDGVIPRPALLANRSQSNRRTTKRDGFTSMWRNAICSGDVTNASLATCFNKAAALLWLFGVRTQTHASCLNVNAAVPLSLVAEWWTQWYLHEEHNEWCWSAAHIHSHSAAQMMVGTQDVTLQSSDALHMSA